MSKTIRIAYTDIELDTIEFLSGSSNYTFVHLVGGKKILASTSLGRMLDQLPDFIRIHKRTAVNPAAIISTSLFSRKESFVVLSRNRTLTISRRQSDLMRCSQK